MVREDYFGMYPLLWEVVMGLVNGMEKMIQNILNSYR